MDGERRIPDRGQTRLAIGFILADDQEPLDRLARDHKIGMVGRIAERIEHQHGVRHRGVDGAEAILAVKPFGDEGHGGVNGAAAR